jgi:hypothetical protein
MHNTMAQSMAGGNTAGMNGFLPPIMGMKYDPAQLQMMMQNF